MTDPNKLKALEAAAPAFKALMSYQQADEEGVMVLTSRQAIHEAVEAYTAAVSALRDGSLIPAQPTPEQGRVEELEKEVEKLRGLLWYAWNEFNTIRARDGAPYSSQYCSGPAMVDETFWSNMTEAFAEAIGTDACKPWPSSEAQSDAVAAALNKGEG